MAIRIRRDVYKLAAWDPILVWYANAITEMQTRPLNDPRSWRYQAAIHELNDDGSVPFWDQCQHNSWFFLPWHRWYLLYFEETVIETIRQLGGPADDWALPYWNYSEDRTKNPDARKLPPAFTATTMPNGSSNPLRVNDRSSAANNGREVAGDAEVSLNCLKQPDFRAARAVGGINGFGGPQTGFNHGGGPVGELEATPHGTVHGAVGGASGFMSFFNTAGLDPIFWLHHANIDRLWVVWRRRDPQHVDPTEAAWLNGVSFPFHDGSGAAVTKTAGGAVDTTALGYEYEDVSDPIAAPAVAHATMAEEEAMAEEDERIPEMVGATDEPVPLRTQPTSAEVPMTPPTGPALRSFEADEEPRRVIVTLENVRGAGMAMNYSVYVNDRLAGVLPMFGVREATRASERHSGSGLEFRFDVTDIIRETNADPSNLRVRFVPLIDEEERQVALRSLESTEAEPEFQIGRVSVHLA